MFVCSRLQIMHDLTREDSKFLDADGYVRYDQAFFVNVLLPGKELEAVKRKAQAASHKRREDNIVQLKRAAMKVSERRQKSNLVLASGTLVVVVVVIVVFIVNALGVSVCEARFVRITAVGLLCMCACTPLLLLVFLGPQLHPRWWTC